MVRSVKITTIDKARDFRKLVALVVTNNTWNTQWWALN